MLFMQYGSIADVFYQWEYLGVFDFLLPFLLVFAIVHGILTSTRILSENKGISVIIAFVIGMLSIRYQYFFSSFLAEIFPRLGIGLTVLLSLMILVGLFIAEDEQKYWGYGLASVGVLIAIIIFYQTASNLGWAWAGGVGGDSVGLIILAILIVGVIIAVAVGGGGGGSRGSSGKAVWKSLRKALGD